MAGKLRKVTAVTVTGMVFLWGLEAAPVGAQEVPEKKGKKKKCPRR